MARGATRSAPGRPDAHSSSSPKTVERHVTNALRKVGARNRTELVALLADQGGGGQSEGFPR
jgi:hypothetical protein